MFISAELHFVRSGVCCAIELIFYTAIIAFPSQLSLKWDHLTHQCSPASPEIQARGVPDQGPQNKHSNPQTLVFLVF